MASMPSSNNVLTAIESYLATRVSLGDQQAKSLHRMLLPLLTSPGKDATQASSEAFEEILDSMAEAGAFDAEAEKAIDKHFAASSEPFGIERARENVVQRLMSAYSGLPITDRTQVVEQHRQALLSVDAAAEALISGLDHAGSLESPNIQRFAQELRYAVAVASGDATRAAVAREVIESAQNSYPEEFYEVEVEMRSKTTFGTDKQTVRVWPGQSAREAAEKVAKGYGAEVVEIRYQDGTLCEPEDVPAAAASYLEFIAENSQLIQGLVQDIGGISGEAHWDLVGLMKDAIGSAEANDSSDEANEQEAAIDNAESWVTDNCSGGDVQVDVAMALWLHGEDLGEAFLREHTVQTVEHSVSGKSQVFDARVEALPRLQQQAGAAYTLYLVASKALQDANGDVNGVDWDQVHQEIFDRAVGQDRQPVASVVDAIKLHSPGVVTPEQIEEVDAMKDDALQPHLMAARARLAGQPEFYSGEFAREISVYSRYEEEQAAYVKMCNATFKIGELLMSQPRGTYLSNAQGGTWLSDAAGKLELYMEWGTDPSRDACNVHDATHCDGIDADDLLAITETIEKSLAEPVLQRESERGLLDALVLRDFGQPLKITPPVATQTNDGPGIEFR